MKRAYMKIGRFPFAFALRGMLALVALMPLYAGAQKAYDARSVLIYVKPDTPGTPNNKPLGIRAGVSVGTVSSFYAHVFDSLKQWKPALDKFITWSLGRHHRQSVAVRRVGRFNQFRPHSGLRRGHAYRDLFRRP